ncbi:Aste57867_7845 [Aphanomyces stellatus]|uniref:ATP-dependent DNA helicase n=1 Tax=Aphanomyces stellatus TaxID=120398 RepID=A0A485KIU0_9STRA|nr:hypothetical protein As57867_007815 [Aphanomyces stellatus]VFT84740.1 Aste57867_7845 [Aphanomyces stellatus]
MIRKASLIIWDEVSMVHRYLIESVDRSLRDITKVDRPFGGIVVVFSGDFKQLLPVCRGLTAGEVVNTTLPHSRLWETISLNCMKLTTNMRLQASGLDPQEKLDMENFSAFLLSIGNGTAPQVDGRIRLPDGMAENYVGPLCLERLIDKIYADVCYVDGYVNWPSEQKQKYLCDRAILAPKNNAVVAINRTVLNLLPGETREYLSADSVDVDGSNEASEQTVLDYPLEFLHGLNMNGFPTHSLRLKVGACFMLLRNLCPANGLCNGTRLIVTVLCDNVIGARILGGDFANNEVVIPRIDLIGDNQGRWPFKLRRRQFPVQVSFAMTIHKSQGQTLRFVGLYIPEPIFSHGQLYVACSRVTSPKNIHILVRNGKLPGHEGVWTTNVVMPGIFRQ